MTILIIEDDQGLVELVKEKVTECGYETALASSAGEGLAWLSLNTPYILLLDYSLPDMSAKELIAEMQSKQRLLPPFIVLTGRGDERIAVEMMKLGARDYIIKDGVFLDRLPEAIRRVAREIENETSRWNAEEVLRQSEERHRTILKTAMDGFWMVDAQARLLEVNEAYCRMSGYTEKELLAMTISDLDVVETADETADRIRKIAEKGGDFFESRHRRKDGTIFDVEIGVRYQDIEGGRSIAFFRDITWRKQMARAQAFLAHTSAEAADGPFFDKLARFLAENLFVDFVCIDRLEGDLLTAQTVSVWHDGKFEDNVTYALKDTPCGDVVGKDVCCFTAGVRHMFPRDQVLQDMQAESYVGVTLWGHAGKPVGLIAVIGKRPLANRKLAEEVLQMVAVRAAGEIERLIAEEERGVLEAQNRQLQKTESLSRMAGAVAHNFNNQLGVVLGNLELAMDDLPHGSAAENRISAAMRAAEKSADMSRLILASLGQIAGTREQIDLSEFCRLSLPRIKGGMPENVKFETDLPSPGPTVKGDVEQIGRVLANLITNAWESIDKKDGSVRLAVKTASPAEIPAACRRPVEWKPRNAFYACLEVRDTGCGIADKDIDNLFDPFFSTKFTGRGLGLAVVLGIVRAYGGAVAIESKPGQGSAFRVFLPVVAADQAEGIK